jgi:glycerol 3-phosphatase-2
VSGMDEVVNGWLVASPAPLVDVFDAALLDLDGTLYRGSEVVPAAPGVVRALREGGVRPAFVTNNASRPPAAVAAYLAGLGVECAVTEVTTAAQAGAALVAAVLPAASPVLVVGGEGVFEALREVGLRPVDSADAGPLAVLQGWAPDLTWRTLAEGAFALAGGIPWFVTNLDLTLPTDRGIAPGNGSFVALLQTVCGREPDAVAGKPMPPLLEQAGAKLGASRPIVVGDRLDTDIRGAAAVSLPSLLVLSGVTDLPALLMAAPAERPTFMAADVRGLLHSHRGSVRAADGRWTCGRWTAAVEGTDDTSGGGARVARIALTQWSATVPAPAGLDGLDAVRATAGAAWESADHGVSVAVDVDLLQALTRAGAADTADTAQSGQQAP